MYQLIEFCSEFKSLDPKKSRMPLVRFLNPRLNINLNINMYQQFTRIYKIYFLTGTGKCLRHLQRRLKMLNKQEI